MPLPGLLGNDRLAQILVSRIRAGTIPHAYMFTGPRGSGRKTLAKAITRLIFCREACGLCPHCQMLNKDIHPDFRVFGAEGEWVRLEQAREFKAFFSYPPNNAPLKVAVLEECQRLTPEAANSLLKVLEDPPANTLLILTAVTSQEVLETITSRCQIMRLQPLPLDLVESELGKRGASQEQAAFLAGYSNGWLGRALEQWQDSGLWQNRSQWANDVAGMLTKTIDPLQVAGDWYESRQTLEFLEYWFRDMLMLQKKPGHLPLNRDLAELLEKSARNCPDEKVIKILENCARANQRLRANCNSRLAMESLLLTLWEG